MARIFNFFNYLWFELIASYLILISSVKLSILFTDARKINNFNIYMDFQAFKASFQDL